MKVNVIKYADDTALFYADSHVNKIESFLNYEMKRIWLYYNQNKLLLNIKKCKTEVMLFGTQKHLKLHRGDLNISYIGTNMTIAKEYLTNLTQSLYWIPILNKSTNVRATDWDFFAAWKYLNNDEATKKFNMIILPILTYSSPVNSTYTKTESERLTSLNNRAKRLTKNGNIKSVLHEVNKQNCIFLKKCLLKRRNSSTVGNYFQVPKHGQRKRNSRIMLKLPPVNSEIYKQSFYFNGARL